jgi:hypothetical protein
MAKSHQRSDQRAPSFGTQPLKAAKSKQINLDSDFLCSCAFKLKFQKINKCTNLLKKVDLKSNFNVIESRQSIVSVKVKKSFKTEHYHDHYWKI